MMNLILVVNALLTVAAPVEADFVVAPNGNDANPGTVEQPFATIAKAQEAVRAVAAKGLTKDIVVSLRAGTYRVEAPLEFGPQDGGNGGHTVTYAAWPGEEVIVSGGRAISGWAKQADGRWTATVPEAKGGAWPFRQLFAHGARLPRGRFPNTPDLLRVEAVSEDVKTITLKSVPFEGNLAGKHAELVMFQNWSVSRSAIVSSDGTALTLGNAMGWIGHGNATTASPNKPCYVENVLEFVDLPGEWYLDRDTGVVTYMAAPDEDPNKDTFVAPVAEQLVVVRGAADAPVRNLRFEGIAFAHTAWPLPAFDYMGIQAGHHGTTMKEPWHVLPLALEFRYADGCAVERCRMNAMGASALGFGAGCRDNSVKGCTVEDIGGNGIMVGWRGPGSKLEPGVNLAADWLDKSDAPANNTIESCLVRECGAVNHGCVGIFDAFAAGTRIAHNVVTAMPYTGVSIGYRWDMSETSQRDCICEYNHIYDTMKMLADGGCIYTLGLQPGTVLRGNVLHDAHRSSYAHGGAPNNGIFFDQGSKALHVEGNTIYNTSGRPVRFNQTNAGELTWENNTFGVGPDYSPNP